MGKKRNENNLNGMDEISTFLNGLSHPTILKWHRDYGFPMRNVGGTWVASTVAIDRWYMTPEGQGASPETSKHREAKTKLDKRQTRSGAKNKP